MINMTDRLADLLVSRATEGLSDAEQHELKCLLEEEGLDTSDDYELAAAAAASAFAAGEFGSID